MIEMVPRELMEMERDRAEMYRDQLACAQAKIVHQKKRLRELERLQATKEGGVNGGTGTGDEVS